MTQTKEFELPALNISLNPNNNIVVIGAYRPPSAHQSALDKLMNLIFVYENSEVLHMGDVTEWSDWDSVQHHRFLLRSRNTRQQIPGEDFKVQKYFFITKV